AAACAGNGGDHADAPAVTESGLDRRRGAGRRRDLEESGVDQRYIAALQIGERVGQRPAALQERDGHRHAHAADRGKDLIAGRDTTQRGEAIESAAQRAGAVRQRVLEVEEDAAPDVAAHPSASQEIGSPRAIARRTGLPMISEKWRGGRPWPGRMLRTFACVSFSPAAISATA